jgi:prophage DNA circulation protein
MDKVDAIEAQAIVQRTLINLLNTIRNTETEGIKAKMVIGWTVTNALSLLYYNQIWRPLDACFDLTRQAGANLAQMEEVRILLDAEQPVSLGATLARNLSIQLCLAQEGKIISAMQFNSRQDVEQIISTLQRSFEKAEEIAADTMDPMVYRLLVELRASIVNHLVSSARPLPAMLTYWFGSSLPSLVISQRLYGDASRYDEIRNENKIIHPAFCPNTGQALAQ